MREEWAYKEGRSGQKGGGRWVRHGGRKDREEGRKIGRGTCVSGYDGWIGSLV